MAVGMAALIETIRNYPDQEEQAADLLMVNKYLERIGDHATNIGVILFRDNHKARAELLPTINLRKKGFICDMDGVGCIASESWWILNTVSNHTLHYACC